MPNKKTIKRSRSRNRKGGFFGFFNDKHNENDEACNPNNLVNLTDSNEMYSNYQKCCPKTWYGRKNNSPYCKQLDLNYKSAFERRKNDANMSKQLINQNFTTDSDNGITLDAVIDCKKPELYNTKEEIENYIENCKCDNLSWYDYSGKTNCGTVKKNLEKLQEKQTLEERPTEVFNPIQQNNEYTPVNQNENISNQEGNNRPSFYNPDVPAQGGKRRKTKKHFKKRSIKKRNGRKSRKH